MSQSCSSLLDVVWVDERLRLTDHLIPTFAASGISASMLVSNPVVRVSVMDHVKLRVVFVAQLNLLTCSCGYPLLKHSVNVSGVPGLVCSGDGSAQTTDFGIVNLTSLSL
jgi:hypothetical protein